MPKDVNKKTDERLSLSLAIGRKKTVETMVSMSKNKG